MKWVIIKGVRYPSSVISAFAAYNMDNPLLKVRIRNKYHIVPFDDVNKMASKKLLEHRRWLSGRCGLGNRRVLSI